VVAVNRQHPRQAARPPRQRRPRLLFFYSPRSGPCRRVEALLAQILQRRQNHDTFELIRVSVELRPELAEQFGVDAVPTLFIVEGRKACKKIADPRSCLELEEALRAWLR
jgi:thioredoxin-like negative regulator of GroEL